MREALTHDLGTAHWCMAMVHENVSPQINVRGEEEEEEEEERRAGSNHCQPSHSPYRTGEGKAVSELQQGGPIKIY